MSYLFELLSHVAQVSVLIIKWILRSEVAVRNRDYEFIVYEDFEAAVRGVYTGKTHKHMIVSTVHNSPVTVYMTEIYYYNFSHNAIHPSRSDVGECHFKSSREFED